MAMLVPLVALGAAAAPPAKPHILFIVSDDLRPTLGTYGSAQPPLPRLSMC